MTHDFIYDDWLILVIYLPIIPIKENLNRLITNNKCRELASQSYELSSFFVIQLSQNRVKKECN